MRDRTHRSLLPGVLLYLIVAMSLFVAPRVDAGVCPAVGDDTGCGVIITITDTGATVTHTGQGPFDGIEDTLVGVVNASSVPVASITLYSGLSIFSFDGDGLATYGYSNASDGSGYGGLNAYFTTTGGGSGTVNFITPLAPKGGSTFFSLEEDITSASACTNYLNNGLSGPTPSGSSISASFTPNLPVPFAPSLATAAQVCGFTGFDWQQTIVSWPAPSDLFQSVGGLPHKLVAPPAFLDPPYGGYYRYPFPTANRFPFYYPAGALAASCALYSDPTYTTCLTQVISNSGGTINFFDAPLDPCLYGGFGDPANCGVTSGGQPKLAPKGAKLAFKTRLVGILPTFIAGSSSNCTNNLTCIDTGIGFDWTSDNNGNNGGVQIGGVFPIVTGQAPSPLGTGNVGAQVSAVYTTTSYGGVGVTAVNGQGLGTLPALTSGAACSGSFGGQFTGDIHVSSGQTCNLVGMLVSGSVHSEGGTVNLVNTSITGNLLLEGGSFTLSAYSVVSGRLNAENLAAATASTMCSSTVYGAVHLEAASGSVQIGAAPTASCAGNVIGANLDVENMMGRVAIFNNVITGRLTCEDNLAISGSGNSSAQESGQCRSF